MKKMLSTMKADITLSETVTLTFPEGWTIDQIAEKLEKKTEANREKIMKYSAFGLFVFVAIPLPGTGAW